MGKTEQEWKDWYQDNKREDALVVVDDLLPILGRTKFEKLVEPDRDMAERYIRKAQQYICGGRKDIPLLPREEHQKVADAVCVCAIASLVEQDAQRVSYLYQMVKESEGCARTNYQFVRFFLRRNLAALLKAHDLDPAVFPEMYGPDVLENLQKGRAQQIIEQTRRWIDRADPLVDVGKKVWNILVPLCQLLTFAKGEFTHFEEVFPVLAALSEQGDKVKLGIMVCKEGRFDYIRQTVERDAPSILCRKADFQIFRYYVFPAEYILMVSGDPRQFLIFWGKTIPEKCGAVRLATHDWKGAMVDGDLAMAD